MDAEVTVKEVIYCSNPNLVVARNDRLFERKHSSTHTGIGIATPQTPFLWSPYWRQRNYCVMQAAASRVMRITAFYRRPVPLHDPFALVVAKAHANGGWRWRVLLEVVHIVPLV